MEVEQQATEENVGLLVLEAKSLRPFKTKDEYLYAMKEDLAEWFKCLYTEIFIDAENFLEVLETGVVLCQHANEVRKFTTEQRAKGGFETKSNFVRDIQIPQYDVQFRIDVKPGTFLARDNISNFITWTSKMGIPEVLRFETDDLVLRKNERSVVLCLLEVARVGAKFGMLAPTIVQMEEEIDNEIETGEPPPQIKTCDIKSLDEMVRELVGRCTCPVQFPIIKVGEGKYKIGDNQTLVFVRILRKHVMIRVGGGWDTLEHYLDRHDPCRCRFEGHRSTSRGPSTPRRSSSSSISQSVPNTPKTPRKLSMTTPIHSGSAARPASPGLRSPSPGPNSKKLNLVVKGASNSQPGSCVTSPNVVGKMPNFPSTASRDNSKQSDLNSSGNYNSGNFVKQSQNILNRQLSSGSGGGTLPRTTTPRRSASPAFRCQSPGPRRSESPAPIVSDRLRSPSPVHSKKKSGSGAPAQIQHNSRNGRCESPIKQITLSELRSSREGKPATSQKPNTPRSIKRQTSTASSNGDTHEMDSDPNNPSLTMDKISTMSLGEFRSLLNNALSVPNGNAGSHASTDSPRSQTSTDSNNKNLSTKSNTSNKTFPHKSAPSSRSTSANRTITSGSVYYLSKPGSVKSSDKANIDSSSSGYSTSPGSIDKPVKPSVSGGSNRSRTPSGRQSEINSQVNVPSNNKSVSSFVNRTNTSSSGYDNRRPKTPTSMYKSNSNASNVSESSNTLQPGYKSNYASRSSSHSSLKSYESTDSHSFDDRSSLHSDHNENITKDPLTPSSATSDYSLRNSYTSNPESPGQTRPNTYNDLLCSEKREIDNDSVSNGVREEVPRNVGFSYMFSYSDKSNDNDTKFIQNGRQELNDLENELADLTARADNEIDSISENSKEDQTIYKSPTARSHTPVGRSQTPSFIPRPMTPKISRKTLSTVQGDTNSNNSNTDDQKRVGRPPTPRKSNIIARAPGPGVRSADKTKEQTYQQIFQKRSMTPGPDSRTTPNNNARRSSTPGPYLQKSNLSSTSATTTRARLNESIEQKNKAAPLSVYNGERTSGTGRARRESAGSVHSRSSSMDRRALNKQFSSDNKQDETVIIVNRSNGQHSLDIQGEQNRSPRTNQTPTKSKVLARARNEETRARVDTKRPITRQRPQSVEPKQLIPRNKLSNNVANTSQDSDDHEAFNRTQEWVQTAVAQTKVQKSKPQKVLPRTRRAMTPNSFDMHKDDKDDEEPRSLDEIKAALSLPINGLTTIEIDPDKLDAPPEDPDAYYQMEKLFNELRQQELKNSVNETPGVGTSQTKYAKSKSSKSKSTSSANDEELSVDSNRNVRKKTLSISTRSSSNVTSPGMSRMENVLSTSARAKPSVDSTTPANEKSVRSQSTTQNMQNLNTRPSSLSPKVKTNTTTHHTSSLSNSSRSTSSSNLSSQRPPSPRTTRPMSPRVNAASTPAPRPASPAFKSPTLPSQKSPTSSNVSNSARPSSPAFKSQSQKVRSPSYNNTGRPSSPAFKSQTLPANTSAPRPSSPAFKSPSQSSRSSLSSTSSQPTRPSSPGLKVSSATPSKPSTPRSQPIRPTSTPPRPSTPVSRQSSKASDDSVFESPNKKSEAVTGSGLLSKLKEIIKVKPRKDKQDNVKVKTRIPAPKSLANHRKSQSFSNLTHLSDSLSLAHTCPDLGKYVADTENINNHVQLNGWTDEEDLNSTISNKGDGQKPRLITPLNTGRSTLIRKESMDKNKEIHKITRAVSVERNMNSLNRYPYLEDGEFV